jgi:competence protein ComEC
VRGRFDPHPALPQGGGNASRGHKSILRLQVAGAAGAVLLGGLIVWNAPEPPPTLTVLSVGQGSCAVLRAGGRTVLFDAGPKNEYVDGGRLFVLPKLRRMGVARVDAVVLSHPDLDHAGGLEALVRAYPSMTILANAGFAREPKLPAMLRELGVPKARVGWLPRLARLRVGALAVDLACPEVIPGANDNEGSVLARLPDAFIGGDAPMDVEARYRTWVGPVGVLVADHHGSRTSGDPAFLALARPKWVVVSVGRNNVYGHPNPQAMARYAVTRATMLRTDRDGDVTFALRDGRWVRL